ncbi:hypothetical protein CYMTET_39326 [Cymbomonas tetramitiformis]|uniref:Uncharacterized protein n=1 Tax=Cymbomonas tetramitiformis TaxID=36881 RepID=A0AAE0CCH0_9CHLO|nr:hypothetical protein CYMTET_39326 [Cymbomonas tetramitiformis]
MKKQVTALANKINGHGYTPRSDKPGHPGPKKFRFAVSDLPTGGSWLQGLSKKIAFDKSKAEFVPGDSVSMNAFATADYELDYLATNFQDALDTGDNDKFTALCVLAGGRPELIDEISAAAFTTEDDSAPLDEYSACIPPSGVHLGGFSVGGAETQKHVTFASANLESADCANVLTDDDDSIEGFPEHPIMSHEWEGTGDLVPAFEIPTTHVFADIVAEDVNANFNICQFANNDSDILPGDSDDESYGTDEPAAEDSAVVPPPPQQSFGGAFSPSFARFATPLLVLALFCVCATAVPVTAYGIGGVSQTAYEPIILTAGGAARDLRLRPEPPPTSHSTTISSTSTFTPTPDEIRTYA